MTQFAVTRTGQDVTEADKAAASRFMFGLFEGLSERDSKAWKSFWRRLVRGEPGELTFLEFWFPRNGRFHRLHFKIIGTVFAEQERFESFDMFRDWLKVGSGWVTWVRGPRGGVVPLPKSISYKKADEEEFRVYHEGVVAFLHSEHATSYLWPKLPAHQRADAINALMTRFE